MPIIEREPLHGELRAPLTDRRSVTAIRLMGGRAGLYSLGPARSRRFGSMVDRHLVRIVATSSCHYDCRYSFGVDVGMAVLRLVCDFDRSWRDCSRVTTAIVLSASLTDRRAGWMTAKSGDGQWQRDLHPVLVGSST